MIRIPLRVSGVDLDDDVTLELLGEHLSDLTWSECGGDVVATLHTPTKNPVATALQAARRIAHVLPQAEVLDVDPELVSASDIATRLGVSREAVRLWVEGLRGPGGFPRPIGTIGNGKSKIWQWSSVNSWMQENYHIGEDEHHLSAEQIAELNAHLLKVKQPIDHEWEAANSYQGRIRPPVERAEHYHVLLAQLTEEILSSRAKGHMNWAIDMSEDSSSWVARYWHQHAASYIEVTPGLEQVEELT
ncbi:helix-turn-helix transcriptional regulator [Micromonospora sp. NPDC047557]|uniref:helix-turn-helix transcriptional regulator n=1 Tax=Micromonospora sp. NPDC047557 TaxID=3364250 RepID=UPI0037183D7B